MRGLRKDTTGQSRSTSSVVSQNPASYPDWICPSSCKVHALYRHRWLIPWCRCVLKCETELILTRSYQMYGTRAPRPLITGRSHGSQPVTMRGTAGGCTARPCSPAVPSELDGQAMVALNTNTTRCSGTQGCAASWPYTSFASPGRREVGYATRRRGSLSRSTVVVKAARTTFAEGARASMPRLDALDMSILKLWFPALLNLLFVPLVGAVDVFWVGCMNQTQALAGQGSANQVYNSAFWIISFLPTLVTPLVARAAVSGNKAELQRHVSEAVVISVIVGAVGTLLLTTCTSTILSCVGVVEGSDIAAHAIPYMTFRALGLIPAIFSTVAFAICRGMMDVTTPLKITAFCQLMNALLDPLLIFGVPACGLPAFGVAGAAFATAISEAASFFLYAGYLVKQDLLRPCSLLKLPALASLKPLFIGAAAVQARAVALNLSFLTVTRATLAMDSDGTASAAHAITSQLWQLGGIVLLAESSIASALVPRWLNRSDGGRCEAKYVANRMLAWGMIAGTAMAIMQILALPLLGVFTGIAAVQQAAVIPSIIGAGLQVINGVVFVGEGIMQGHQAYKDLAAHTVLACGCLVASLHSFGGSLIGVWGSFWVFNSIRLVFTLRHHFHSGPLASVSPKYVGYS